MRTKKDFSVEEEVSLPNSTQKHFFLSKKSALISCDGKVKGIIGISFDITERKQYEEEIKSSKKAAEAANHAKTEFIANMSHDIRTPLSGVVGLGGIVEKEVSDPRVKAKIHDMIKSADELLNMLNEILDVVSMDDISVQNIHSEPFDLHHVVQTIVDLEQSSVDLKKIQLLQSIDNKIPRILIGDHKKIHHILLNLVGNAIKFTQTGHVSIDITLSKVLDDEVELLFMVSDTGIGIPKESMPKVFELFYKVTPSYKGLGKGHGVGLHIAKTYTEILGGKINVESEINKGSKFYFSLPLRVADNGVKAQNITYKSLDARAEEGPLYVPEASIKLANAPLILVVEDNDI